MGRILAIFIEPEAVKNFYSFFWKRVPTRVHNFSFLINSQKMTNARYTSAAVTTTTTTVQSYDFYRDVRTFI
uniref:Uncharacterized protein n=1 Tax=Trichogramma kaykai TaxID=54128 RepID=A0ABD2VUW5_9HYME